MGQIFPSQKLGSAFALNSIETGDSTLDSVLWYRTNEGR